MTTSASSSTLQLIQPLVKIQLSHSLACSLPQPLTKELAGVKVIFSCPMKQTEGQSATCIRTTCGGRGTRISMLLCFLLPCAVFVFVFVLLVCLFSLVVFLLFLFYGIYLSIFFCFCFCFRDCIFYFFLLFPFPCFVCSVYFCVSISISFTLNLRCKLRASLAIREEEREENIVTDIR